MKNSPLAADEPASWPLMINGRAYAAPKCPVVVICLDGCDPAYLRAAEERRAIPVLSGFMRSGFYRLAHAAIPTFTNPNNVAIVCGAPPSVTGVAGNYYLDRQTGREVMVLDGHLMQADTILARLAEAGVKAAVVTAKDKLLRALARGLDGIACSAESPEHARDVIGEIGQGSLPEKYSADLSLFVLDAGVALLNNRAADVIYLSLSDYIQHKHAPDEPQATAFMQAVDRRLGAMAAQGAIIGITADHGMSDMARPDGSARVVYVQDEIEARFGEGTARVICPITDPFTRHHASLGGFVRVYLRDPALALDDVRDHVAALEGVELVLTGPEACARYELPAKGEGDLVVIAAPGFALGARADEHDLSQLAGTPLRSHGGTAEQLVPFILSHPVERAYAERAQNGLRNFDIFDFALNGVIP
ncbi:phosphonoacetate hydrolase [Chelativorans sp.]|uniref:phosphonoacetate hydrolase n=1 Tax=Chelativorans sp. TaxID=2203393 RepID=UPI00281215C3|nr:phosphonoacetate hydrolase [Chelativorans sp.]